MCVGALRFSKANTVGANTPAGIAIEKTIYVYIAIRIDPLFRHENSMVLSCRFCSIGVRCIIVCTLSRDVYLPSSVLMGDNLGILVLKLD